MVIIITITFMFGLTPNWPHYNGNSFDFNKLTHFHPVLFIAYHSIYGISFYLWHLFIISQQLSQTPHSPEFLTGNTYTSSEYVYLSVLHCICTKFPSPRERINTSIYNHMFQFSPNSLWNMFFFTFRTTGTEPLSPQLCGDSDRFICCKNIFQYQIKWDTVMMAN